MSEDPMDDLTKDNPFFEKPKKVENQTSELKHMLDVLNAKGAPVMKSSADIGVVKQPSFISGPGDAETSLSASEGDPTAIPHERPTSVREVEEPISEKPTGEFFLDTEIFIKQLGRAYIKRYEMWEETTNSILTILRKMKNVQENNTQTLINTIEEIHWKIQKGFEDFTMKRSEVERFSNVSYKDVAKTFKKTLELLNFQVREFKLQQEIEELYNIYAE